MILNKYMLSDQIVEDIKQKVASREFLPGQKLVIRELKEMYNVSSSPIRDALAKLAHFGFVKFGENSSFYVPKLNKAEKRMLIDVYQQNTEATLRLAIRYGQLGTIIEKMEAQYERMLHWEDKPVSEQLRMYVDFVNIPIENVGNPFYESIIESVQGYYVAAFGDYSCCMVPEEVRKSAGKLLVAIKAGDMEATMEGLQYPFYCFERYLDETEND